MKKFSKATAGIIAALTMTNSIVGISASASNTSSWYIQRIAGSPSSTDMSNYSDSVSGLVNYNDNGITFKCTYYYDRDGVGYVGKGDISPNLKLQPNVYAIMNYNGKQSTCLFVSNWYALSGYDGIVEYTVESAKYNSILGSYVSYFDASHPFKIMGTAK